MLGRCRRCTIGRTTDVGMLVADDRAASRGVRVFMASTSTCERQDRRSGSNGWPRSAPDEERQPATPPTPNTAATSIQCTAKLPPARTPASISQKRSSKRAREDDRARRRPAAAALRFRLRDRRMREGQQRTGRSSNASAHVLPAAAQPRARYHGVSSGRLPDQMIRNLRRRRSRRRA